MFQGRAWAGVSAPNTRQDKKGQSLVGRDGWKGWGGLARFGEVLGVGGAEGVRRDGVSKRESGAERRCSEAQVRWCEEGARKYAI